MTVGQVLERLEGVRPCAGGHIAGCPAHADHSPSLPIYESADGRLLPHCFAGCTWKSVLAALGNGSTVPSRSYFA
jgi:putative DNA primase/helicase